MTDFIQTSLLLTGADPLPSCAQVDWTPTREAGLARLRAFVPAAGRAYARDRNVDRGPQDRSNVSALSPWIRRRLITETEVLAAVLQQHRLVNAQKFVDEVFWRSYWKGWLQQRPQVYAQYRQACAQWLARLDLAWQWEGGRDLAMAQRYQQALAGRTGIACFDAWMQELLTYGWLHNHARMWFASIWVFTLKLPWELGAGLFEHHLLDADPASNTLSWRWVAGLHTRGKHYVARADNIRVNTLGRFDPQGQLDEQPLPVPWSEPEDELSRTGEQWREGLAGLSGVQAWVEQPNRPDRFDGRGRRVALLLHDEDLSLQSWCERLVADGLRPVAVVGLEMAGLEVTQELRLAGLGPGLAPSKGPVRVSTTKPVARGLAVDQSSAERVRTPIRPAERFRRAAMDDALSRSVQILGLAGGAQSASALDEAPTRLRPDQIQAWMMALQVDCLVTPLAPVGPTADSLRALGVSLARAGLQMVVLPTVYDQLTWPHATAGFFKFRQQIPQWLQTLVLVPASGSGPEASPGLTMPPSLHSRS